MAKQLLTTGLRYLPALLSAVLAAKAAAPTIETKPRGHAFLAMARGPNPRPHAGVVSNVGSGSLSWQVTGKQAAWLTVAPLQGTAPSSMSFSVSTAGMKAGTYYDTVRVTSNDPNTPTDTIPILLRILEPPPVPPNGRLTAYDVEFAMTGYVGELNGAPQCKVRLNGFDRMVGMIVGVETPEQDEDIIYTGLLERDTDLDYCLTRGRKSPGDDERVWCELSLKGWSFENVELTVHSDSARGGYLKSETEPGYSSAGIKRNSCDTQEKLAAANGYANGDDGGGGSPNGQQIDDLKGTDSTGKRIVFSPNHVPRLRVGTFPPENRAGWTLRVIRKIL